MIAAFCMPGRHAAEIPSGESMDVRQTLPPGWRLVRANVTPSREWFADPTSGASIICCPDHPLGDM
jgi:hypothetical protein